MVRSSSIVRAGKASKASKANASKAISKAVDKLANASLPDVANAPTASLLATYWTYVKNPLADVASAATNMVGGDVSQMGTLAPLGAVCLALRKAYGRGIARKLVESDLGITIPDGFNPTFALYLSAARIRPDNASERKVAQSVTSAIRAKIRETRKA